MISRFLRILLLLPFLILTSCFEGEEEIWIESDGTGRLLVNYKIPSLAMKQLGDPESYVRAIKLIDENEENLKIQKISFTSEGGSAVLHIEATFENVLDLLDLAKRSEAILVHEASADPDHLEAIVGDIELGMSGLHPKFERSVQLGPIFPSMIQKRPAILGKSSFRYTLHLPFAIQETNADEVSKDRKTAYWNFLLKDYGDKPMVMIAKTETPFPWWAWLILAALILLLAFFFRFVWKQIKRRMSPA